MIIRKHLVTYLKCLPGILSLMLGVVLPSNAQQDTLSVTSRDSVRVFPLEALYDRILEHHPVVKQAGLLTEEASRQIAEARGAFDPKLESTYDRKVYQDKHYYTSWRSELKVPLLTNTDLKLGYERNTGPYLNPEKTVPEDGLMYAGISVPLGRGLFTDQRRTDLRTVGFNRDIAEAERIKMLNKLLYEAAKDYWEWSQAYYRLRITEEGVILARTRFEGIKENVEIGESAVIDSVEAKITLQSRMIDYEQSRLDYRNAYLKLSVYLWDEDGNPLLPASNIAPDTVWDLDGEVQGLEIMAELARRQHPDLRKLTTYVEQLEVEERLYRELLKPLVNINYNYLNLPGNMLSELSQSTFTQNYKLGVDFSFPLLLRKERAKLQLNRIKQQRTRYALSLSQREIDNTLRQAYNEFLALQDMQAAQQSIVRNYQQMVEGEIEKFNAGESSLFLVNQRENSLLESRLKLLSLSAKYQKAKAAVLWSAGMSVPDGLVMPEVNQGSMR